MSESEQFIDVERLLNESSLESLNKAAEDYFARLTTWDHHLAKPFGSIDETPQLLINFAVILQGLRLCPGMTILEFGAGTCWASRFLNQLGCQVIAVDISATALRMGQELYARQPLIGNQPEPRFLLFDGKHLDLPSESVDRIICLDAFHHVPNPAETIREMARVLKNGGIAGFAEPGPNHSRSAQSQYEMRVYGVLENNIDVQQIWRFAQPVGFTEMKLAVFNVPPLHLTIKEFADFISGGKTGKRWLEATRVFMENERNFFLYKGEPEPLDSRFKTGLVAKIIINPDPFVGKAGETIRLQALVTNISESVWLPRSAGLGAVLLGCHVYYSNNEVYRQSYHWEPLTPGEGRPILPKESVSFDVNIPALDKGNYILEFDMISNDVCWFALNGSPTVRISAQII